MGGNNDYTLTALYAITGKDTSATWTCYCLLSNVCASVKALMACICRLQSAVCCVFITIVSRTCDFPVKAFLFTINTLSALHDTVPKRQLYLLAGVRLSQDFIAHFPLVTTVERKNFSTVVVDLGVSLTMCVYPLSSVSTVLRQQLNTTILLIKIPVNV